jgi:hypothetical protein
MGINNIPATKIPSNDPIPTKLALIRNVLSTKIPTIIGISIAAIICDKAITNCPIHIGIVNTCGIRYIYVYINICVAYKSHALK